MQELDIRAELLRIAEYFGGEEHDTLMGISEFGSLDQVAAALYAAEEVIEKRTIHFWEMKEKESAI